MITKNNYSKWRRAGNWKAKLLICVSVFDHIAFSTKQWNLNLPPTLSQNQIATTVEDFNESVQAADVEAFILREDFIKIAPSSFVGICGIFE